MLSSSSFIFHAFLETRLELSEVVLLAGSVKTGDILKDFHQGVGFLWLLSVFLKKASYLSLLKVILYL